LGDRFTGIARMSGFQINRRFFESPHPATYFLLTANIVVYGLCVSQSGLTAIPPAMLFRNGAMYASAIDRQEYWRLIASGFLHANLLHLATNMICLALWGGHLEKRIGSSYFVLVYLCALATGAIVSNLTHAGQYLSVGASGAISGVLGALLCLRISAKIDLPLNFFAINIGLNVVLAFSARNIDWGAHVGGFVAGIAACAVLDAAEKANGLLLRCKFPEFAKMNLILLVVGFLFLTWFRVPVWALLIACLLTLAVIKLFDLVLSQRKGLAIAVVGFSIVNAMFLVFFAALFAPTACARSFSPAIVQMKGLLAAPCAHGSLTLFAIAAGASALTLLLYSQELYRGLHDKGFVSAGMTGERRRRQGL
jgi:membrane associated rhomboid family serine protease